MMMGERNMMTANQNTGNFFINTLQLNLSSPMYQNHLLYSPFEEYQTLNPK